MVIRVGNGFYLSNPLGVGGMAANGTVLSATDLGRIARVRTDGSLVGHSATMHVGDSVIVDTDDDGDFSDEAATTQTDNDRFSNSIITYSDNTTSVATVELVTLSDGSQVIVITDSNANDVNAASGEIRSITLGTFNNRYDNIYNQNNFSNDITNMIVCFAGDTYIQTPFGEKKIKTLNVGDHVITADDGAQKIRWIGKRRISSAQLAVSPHLKPVCIRAGALGRGLPKRDLLVSPQHRILLVSKIAKRMFGQSRVFVPAIKLVDADGIAQISSVKPVTYVHMLFDKHQVVFANGAPAESLNIGSHALRAISEEAREEIFEIFPELRDGEYAIPLAYQSIEKQSQVSKLVARHERNYAQLVKI